MKDEDKTKEQPKDELVELRKRIAELNVSETERKQVEEALRESGKKKKYRDSLEKMVEERTNELKVANEQLQQEVMEHRQREKVHASIYKISEAVHTVESLEELYRSIHNIITELMPAKDNFYIALYDADSEMLNFPYFVDEDEENPGPQKLGKGLTEYLLRTGKPLLASPDVFEELEKRGEVESVGPPSIDWLGVPLKAKDKTIGVMVVQSYIEGVRYTEEDRNILMFISEQVAMAIERKRVEEALRRSEERLSSLFDGVPIGLYQSTPEGKNIDANPALLQMLRLPNRKAMLDEDVVCTYVNPDDRRRWQALIEREGTVQGFEAQWRRFDGTVIWIRENARVVRNSEGRVLYYEGAVEDITERKNAEEKLTQTLAELERSNRDLEQFAYMSSHDLQEPLRMVSSYTQLLGQRYKDKLDADAKEFIEYAIDGATRMQTLINDLLTYSRVSTRGEPFELTDCETVLEKVLVNLQVAIEESGAVVTHDPLPTIMVDASQLIQLFQNLIGNAVKFRSEAPPRVHISAEQKRNELIFSVRDNGIGIDPQYREQIFEICQRLHSRAEYPGTGIGLAICKKIVERHGGRIWEESNSRKGSTFYFTTLIKGGK